MIAADKQATKRAKPQQRLILLIPCLCHTPSPPQTHRHRSLSLYHNPLSSPPVPSLVHFPLVFPQETLAAYGFHRSIANFLSFRLCAHFTKWQVETLPLYTSHTQFHLPSLPLPFPFPALSLYSCHQRHSNLSFASFFIMLRRLKQHDVFIFVVFIPRPMCLTPRPASLVRVCVAGLLQVAFNLILHLLLLFHRSSTLSSWIVCICEYVNIFQRVARSKPSATCPSGDAIPPPPFAPALSLWQVMAEAANRNCVCDCVTRFFPTFNFLSSFLQVAKRTRVCFLFMS